MVLENEEKLAINQNALEWAYTVVEFSNQVIYTQFTLNKQQKILYETRRNMWKEKNTYLRCSPHKL